jgi:hypothetical protein
MKLKSKEVGIGWWILEWKNWLVYENPDISNRKRKKITHAAHETIRILMEFGYLRKHPENKIEFLEAFEEWLRNNMEKSRYSLYPTIMICHIKHTLGLPFIDDDGNVSQQDLHIYRGVNTKEKIWEHPCHCCGSLTYLGVFIPTVTVFVADYYEPSFQCHNPNCSPIYDEFGLKDYGAYWSYEDEYYYTPQNPRL